MAVGRALASVGSLSQAALDTFCTALPDAPQLFEVGQGLQCTEDIALRCAGNDELTALACVAAARLFDTGPVARRTATAQSTTSATNPAIATASATAAATPAAAAPPPATAATPIATNALAWTVSAAPAPPAADADRAARAEEAIP
jgi:hypothetical protein